MIKSVVGKTWGGVLVILMAVSLLASCGSPSSPDDLYYGSEEGSDGYDYSGQATFPGAGWYRYASKTISEAELYIQWDSKGNCLRIGMADPYGESPMDEETKKKYSYSSIKDTLPYYTLTKLSSENLPDWAK